MARLLERMLDMDPEKRPEAMEVFQALRPTPEAVPPKPVVSSGPVIESSTLQENPFFRPGDLN